MDSVVLRWAGGRIYFRHPEGFLQSVPLKISLIHPFSNCSGSTAEYCDTGCQTEYGICGSPSMSPVVTGGTIAGSSVMMSPSISGSGAISMPTGAGVVSPDCSCGGPNEYTCVGYGMGECCSS